MSHDHALVDHEQKVYYDMGTGFCREAFRIAGYDQSAECPSVNRGARVPRFESIVDLAEQFLVALRPDSAHGLNAFYLRELARDVHAFLIAHPNACFHYDCGDDYLDGYTEVRSRYNPVGGRGV